MSHSDNDCSNQQCTNPNCTNPNCYNYNPHNIEQASDTDEPIGSHEKVGLKAVYVEGRGHGKKSAIKKRIYDHQHKIKSLMQSSNDLDYHDSLAERERLNIIDHALDCHVRPILDRAQNLLFDHGYTTGLFPETETYTPHDCDDSEHQTTYTTGMSLYMYDTPVAAGNTPSKDSLGTSRIYFNQILGTSKVQCQFNNSQIQSQLIPISFHHHNEVASIHFPDPIIKSLVDDFVTLVLLGKRAGLTQLSG